MVCWSQAGLILPLGSQYCVLTSPRDLVSYQGLLALHETVWLSEFGEGEDLLLFQLGKLLFSVKFVVLMNEWFQFPLAGGSTFSIVKKKKKKSSGCQWQEDKNDYHHQRPGQEDAANSSLWSSDPMHWSLWTHESLQLS